MEADHTTLLCGPGDLFCHALLTRDVASHVSSIPCPLCQVGTHARCSHYGPSLLNVEARPSDQCDVVLAQPLLCGVVPHTVSVLFAWEFHALRSLLCEDGAAFATTLHGAVEKRMATGKSGARFYVSADRQFVIKSIRESEAQAFRGHAADYFRYLGGVCADGRPSLLMPIYAMFKLDASLGGKTDTSFWIVQRNLTYPIDRFNSGRPEAEQVPYRVFDLKGFPEYDERQGWDGRSIARSRDLLLQEDWDVMDAAISNDTQFLASHNVVDYSILICIPDKPVETNFSFYTHGASSTHGGTVKWCLGLIDFLCPYDLRRRLEDCAKSYREHAIISPPAYAARIREAVNAFWRPTGPSGEQLEESFFWL